MLNSFEQYEKPIQVLCLQETWIVDADFIDLSLFQIQDYNLITQNRYASAHGGLAYCIHKNWAYTIRTCENKSQYWEEMFITLTDQVETKQNKFSIANFIDHHTPRSLNSLHLLIILVPPLLNLMLETRRPMCVEIIISTYY